MKSTKSKKIVKKRKDYTVRTKETGDKVYLIKDGKRHWIKNPETLKALGFWFGDEDVIKYKELLEFKEGKPIDLKQKAEVKEPKITERLQKQTHNLKADKLKTLKPILGYKEVATMEDFKEEQKKYDEK